MAGRITVADTAILSYIAEYKFLTVKQIAALTQRSLQVIRRRLRFFEDESLVVMQERGFGKGPGRRENIIILTEPGIEVLSDKGILCEHAAYVTDKRLDSIIDHDLLVNWFFIHLIQIGREKPCLSTKHLTISSHNLKQGNVDKPLLMERFSSDESSGNYHSMIPDGVFTITDKESEKTLLFFLEVDMGTETLVNTKQSPNDIRQKIINYQALFRTGRYRRYEKIFKDRLNGFRLLFLCNIAARLNALCRLVRQMPPADFIWLADQNQMFSNGIAAEIWVRGGKDDEKLQSIVGHKLACKITITDKMR
jgi:hypothetical protein